MKVLSLFDGIAGARQALKELNIDCEYYASEVDKYAIQVAKANHPDIKYPVDVLNGGIQGYADVRNLKKHHLAEWQYINENGGKIYDKVPIIDLLIGGSPCQDLSIAKKDRKGLEGNRSSLFYEYLRILKELQPKYFILENVASMSKESKAIITKELFGIEPVMINSALLTAQNRKRLYWVGELVDGKYQQVKIEQPEDKEIYLKDIIESGYNTDLTFAHVDTSRIIKKANKAGTLTATYYKGINGAGRPFVASNSVIGEYFYNVNKPIKIGHFNKGGQGDRVYSQEGKSVCLSANGGGRGAKTGLYAIAQRGRNIVDGKRKDIKGAKTEQRFETSFLEKANTLTTVQKDSMLLDGYIIRKLTPTECCRLQGFPDNYVSMVSNTQGYKALGNSFTVPVIKKILLDFL